MFVIREEANSSVIHGIMRQRPGLACSRRHQVQRSALRRSGDHPFPIRRDGSGQPFANLRGWRPIRIAKEYGVVCSTAIAFLLEQNFSAVLADVAWNRPPEPA